MKIQCSCGSKYSFDVTPESAANPVRFICPNCGVDSSDAVNQLIRQQFGLAAPPAPTVAQPPPAPPAVPAAPTASKLRISHDHPPAASPAPVAAPAGAPAQFVACPKHPNELAEEKCAVCHKPICPKCMALFGYFCSPFCKSKAAAESLKVPEYAGSVFAADKRFHQKTGRIITAVAVACLLIAGLSIWYNFYAAIPHETFRVRFDQRAEYGQCRAVGANQLVFIHGSTFARYDLQTQKPVWTHEVFTQQDVDELAARLGRPDTDTGYHISGQQLAEMARAELEGALSLAMSGSNVWLINGPKMVHYDWITGNELQSVNLGDDHGEMIATDDELLMLRESDTGAKSVTHINYATGESRTEEFHETGKMVLAGWKGQNPGGGLPEAGGQPGQPLDPNQVADQAQNLTTPGRIALPALLANNIHQQQLMAAMRDADGQPHRSADSQTGQPLEEFTLVPSKYGFLQYSVKLVEEHTITRSAMKAPPAKKILDGNLTAGQDTEAANEMLNDMQRANGGDQVSEDASLYQVIVRRPDAADTADWSGMVTGSPTVYSLPTVNVIAAGKTITVLDKANKKLWDASLTYQVSANPNAGHSLTGESPCAESGDTLYVVDQAVLTAFDKSSGNARWRLPSVGIVGLFFDNEGAIYVNTTTASLDKIKYSRQIDIAESIDTVVMKVDAQTGKTLWSVKTGGFASYVSGPFIYTVLSHDKPQNDLESDLTSALQKPSFLRIRRLSPRDGRLLWEHDDDSAPIDLEFNKNNIYLVFHKEVDVLKYLTF